MTWVIFFCSLASLLFALARFGPALDRAGERLGWRFADHWLIGLRIREILAGQDAEWQAAARPASYGLWQAIRPVPSLASQLGRYEPGWRGEWQWLCPERHHGNHRCAPGRCRCGGPRW